MLVVIFLQFVEKSPFVLACINMVQTVVHQVVWDISDTEPNPEECEEDRVMNSDDFNGKREQDWELDGK